MLIRDESDKQLVWNELKNILRSFSQQGSLPKGGRWFSLNDVGEEGIKEWWATRMVLEVYLGWEESSPENASSADIKQLKRNGGGLKLAYFCTSQRYWEDAVILLVCGRPCHKFFSRQASQVKSAEDNLNFVLSASGNALGMPHLQELASMLSARPSLTSFEHIATWASDTQDFAKRVWKYVTALLAQCAGSMTKLNAPPYSYAGILRADGRSLRQMKKTSCASVVSKLETAHNVPGSNLLLNDLRPWL